MVCLWSFPYGPEENVNSVVGWNVLHMFGSSRWFIVFIFSISLLIFCLVVLSIENGVLKSPPIVELSMYLSNSVNVCYICFGALMFGTCIHIYNCYLFLVNWPFYQCKRRGSRFWFVKNATSVKRNKTRHACIWSDVI